MEPSTMWELAFLGLLVLLGGSLGYTLAQVCQPGLTAEQIRAIIDEQWSGPAEWDDHDAEFFTRVVHDALGAFSPLNAGDVRQVVLAALDEHRDSEIARVSHLMTKRGTKKAARASAASSNSRSSAPAIRR